VIFRDTDDSGTSESYAFNDLPIPIGPKSSRPEAPVTSLSKGTGETRQMMRLLDESLALGNDLSLQQSAEVNEGGRTGLQSVHPVLLQVASLDRHVPTPQKKPPPKPSTNRVTVSPPVVEPDSVADKEVKERTGFESLLLLLCFVAIVCDGDVDSMTMTTSSLTWFEEWFFFFEMVWGRSLSRWVDAERVYKINQRILRDVFARKLAMVLSTVAAWPRYIYHDEDVKLRSSKWRERYKNKRIIMWDNTNVDFLGKPTDADLQRLTYSLYYGCNVAKGGIFLQLCGWLGG